MTKGMARRLRREHSARDDAPHYTPTDIATVYVADRLRIDVDVAARLTARPRAILVGDCTPTSLLAPPASVPVPMSRPQPTLSQLLAAQRSIATR